MSMIHPRIYQIIPKCYYRLEGESYEYFITLIDLLNLTKKYNLVEFKNRFMEEFKTKNPRYNISPEYESILWNVKDISGGVYSTLVEYLKSLPDEDILMILSDLMADQRFDKLVYIKWNYYGDYVNEWPGAIKHCLGLCGVEWDATTKNFTIKEKEGDIKKVISTPNIIQINFEDIFYRDLIKEINSCYKFGHYTATIILSRKLIENLLIDVLKKKFPLTTNIYLRKDGRFLDLSILLKNLEDKKTDFGSNKEVVEEFLKLISPFRESANRNAHSIIIIGNRDELAKYPTEKMVGLLIRLRDGVL